MVVFFSRFMCREVHGLYLEETIASTGSFDEEAVHPGLSWLLNQSYGSRGMWQYRRFSKLDENDQIKYRKLNDPVSLLLIQYILTIEGFGWSMEYIYRDRKAKQGPDLISARHFRPGVINIKTSLK